MHRPLTATREHVASCACVPRCRRKSSPSTLHRVDSEHALDALVARLGLDWQLAGNLRQLCSYRSIDGKGPERTAKKRAAEWKVLDAVVWIKRNNVLLPVVGARRRRWLFSWS